MLNETSKTFNGMKEKILLIIFGCFALASLVSVTFGAPPSQFPKGQTIEITAGTSLSQTAQDLYDAHVTRSIFLFKALVVLQSGQRSVVAGDYYFDKPETLGMVTSRLVAGDFRLVLVKATIPEGWTNVQIADYLSPRLSHFDADIFLATAPQGYLFPDTYYFFPDTNTRGVLGRMQDVFNTKTATLKSQVRAQGKNFANVVVIASILEEEAKTIQDKEIIAGILLKRLSLNMPLQVDSATSTYKTKGLPLVPITNPGLDSLNAAFNPVTTDYLYYLSDLSGQIYYAKTFEEHQQNVKLHLGQ
jgi:UPF0755 protein